MPFTWIGRFNSIKMSTPPEVIYRFNAISINIPIAFFCSNRKRHPVTHTESQGITK